MVCTNLYDMLRITSYMMCYEWKVVKHVSDVTNYNLLWLTLARWLTLAMVKVRIMLNGEG